MEHISIHALREEGDAIRYFVRTKRLVKLRD